MTNALKMIPHAIGVGISAYIAMVLILGQSPEVAQKRSIILASMLFVYMMIFDHKMPSMQAVRDL